MANHVVLTAPDSVPHHVNHVKEGTIIDRGHSHQVVGPDMDSLDEKHGASHTTSLHELANKDHDTEAHFSGPGAKPMRAHLPVSKEQ
jgi:hypothetical protein